MSTGAGAGPAGGSAPTSTSATITVPGKRVWIPQTGHLDQSFAVEHHYADLDQSELFLGCKPVKIAVGLPATGLVTFDMDVAGQDMSTVSGASAPYYTSPTAATTTGLMAAVNGVLRIGGSAVVNITGLSLEISCGYSGDAVAGSNVVPFQFAGRVLVSGQLTAYFSDVTLRDAFKDETAVDLIGVFSTGNEANANFVSFVLPRVKLGGSSKNDGEGGLVQTIPFRALLNGDGGSGTATEKTTILIQDSAVS